MEEDIKILEHLKNDFIRLINKKDEYVIEKDKREKEVKAIENIINKNKELEKMVELMAEWISNNCFYSDAYSNSCEIIQDSCYKNLDCKKCIIGYFKKKASEENG